MACNPFSDKIKQPHRRQCFHSTFSSDEDEMTSPIISLPREIQDEILQHVCGYHHILIEILSTPEGPQLRSFHYSCALRGDDDLAVPCFGPWTPSPQNSISALFTSRQIHDAAAYLFYAQNAFIISGGVAFTRFLDTVPAAYVSSIRYLEIRYSRRTESWVRQFVMDGTLAGRLPGLWYLRLAGSL